MAKYKRVPVRILKSDQRSGNDQRKDPPINQNDDIKHQRFIEIKNMKITNRDTLVSCIKAQF